MNDKVVFGYVRVSSAGQGDKDGPIRQREAISKFCDTYSLPYQVFKEDLGVSGTVDGMDRPGLFSILAEAERLKGLGISVCMVVENMDRFARDLIVSELLIRELGARSVTLYAANLGFEDQVTSNAEPGRTLVRQILGALAQYEKSSIVLKLRCARERRKRETGKCDGARGYGCDSKATSGKSERIILNLIQELREAGSTWESVAVMFNASAIKSRAGHTHWTRDQLFKIWKNHTERQNKQKGKT